MSSQYYWMNCGYCGLNITKRPSSSLKFYITACQFIFCHGCARQCRQPACFSCKANCQVVPICNQMPPNVKKLLKLPAEEINDLKQALAFHIKQYDAVISRLGSLIQQRQMELAEAKQKLQESAVRLKELDGKIPEAQQMLEKLQKTVKMLTSTATDNRQSRSSGTGNSAGFMAPGVAPIGRSSSLGGQNGGMGSFKPEQNGANGRFMGGKNTGMGGGFMVGQNGGGGGFMGGQNGGGRGLMGGQNGGMGGQNGGMGGQNGGGGGLMGGQNRGKGGQNGGGGGFMAGQNGSGGGLMGGQNGGRGGFTAGQNEGFGNFMGGQSNNMVGQTGRMLNAMAMGNNGGGHRINGGQGLPNLMNSF